VWSLEVDPGDREASVELTGVAELPAGTPIFAHGVMWPGVPGMGVTEQGEVCVSVSAGMMQGTRVGPLAVLR
jgi:hypothetical protein